MSRTLPAGARTVAAAVALTSLAISFPSAAPAVSKSPSPSASQVADPFYTVPRTLPAGPHGTLIKRRPISASNTLGLLAQGHVVMYTSTGADQQYRPDQAGRPTAVTGTVLVPRTPWKGPGPRPVVSFAMGTQGQGSNCAPSKQYDANTEYQVSEPRALLLAGYAVTITDYQGYTNGHRHPYAVGQVLGHNVLDIVRAARAVPNSGITTRSPIAIWGYSEGGAAASWAGQLASSYTPEMQVKGVAAGGTPTSLFDTARYLNRSLYFDFLLNALAGFDAAYPRAGFLELLNTKGRAAVAYNHQTNRCLIPTVLAHPLTDIAVFLRADRTLDDGLDVQPIRQALSSNTLGNTPITAPTYLYWSTGDAIVPPATQARLFSSYCALNMTVKRTTYGVLDHLTTSVAAVPTAIAWLQQRFNGQPAASSCPK